MMKKSVEVPSEAAGAVCALILAPANSNAANTIGTMAGDVLVRILEASLSLTEFGAIWETMSAVHCNSIEEGISGA
jgi:hypothetical protein